MSEALRDQEIIRNKTAEITTLNFAQSRLESDVKKEQQKVLQKDAQIEIQIKQYEQQRDELNQVTENYNQCDLDLISAQNAVAQFDSTKDQLAEAKA